jgi:hypothetical protein
VALTAVETLSSGSPSYDVLRDDDNDGPDSRLETNAAAADDVDDEELDKGVCTGEPIDQSPTTELELVPA